MELREAVIPGGIEDPGGLAPNGDMYVKCERLLTTNLINRTMSDLDPKPKPRKTLHRTVSYELALRFKNDTRATATKRK